MVLMMRGAERVPRHGGRAPTGERARVVALMYGSPARTMYSLLISWVGRNTQEWLRRRTRGHSAFMG